ncbi:hypothetical protein DENSPDRAFT_886861 [Dentipellis sp. KUC8613]|nr:hypothetical protein DENSPDRAFT_886861 [Dentipellis sp. KUC8613]
MGTNAARREQARGAPSGAGAGRAGASEGRERWEVRGRAAGAPEPAGCCLHALYTLYAPSTRRTRPFRPLRHLLKPFVPSPLPLPVPPSPLPLPPRRSVRALDAPPALSLQPLQPPTALSAASACRTCSPRALRVPHALSTCPSHPPHTVHAVDAVQAVLLPLSRPPACLTAVFACPPPPSLVHRRPRLSAVALTCLLSPSRARRRPRSHSRAPDPLVRPTAAVRHPHLPTAAASRPSASHRRCRRPHSPTSVLVRPLLPSPSSAHRCRRSPTAVVVDSAGIPHPRGSVSHAGAPPPLSPAPLLPSCAPTDHAFFRIATLLLLHAHTQSFCAPWLPSRGPRRHHALQGRCLTLCGTVPRLMTLRRHLNPPIYAAARSFSTLALQRPRGDDFWRPSDGLARPRCPLLPTPRHARRMGPV